MAQHTVGIVGSFVGRGASAGDHRRNPALDLVLLGTVHTLLGMAEADWDSKTVAQGLQLAMEGESLARNNKRKVETKDKHSIFLGK